MVSPVRKIGEKMTFDLLVVFFLMQPRILLAFFAMRVDCWCSHLIVHCGLLLSAKLLSSWSFPSIYWCLAFFHRKYKTLYFRYAQFSSPLRSLWTAAQCFRVSTTPPRFVSTGNFLRMSSVPVSSTVMERLNDTGLSTQSVLLCDWPLPSQASHIGSHSALT